MDVRFLMIDVNHFLVSVPYALCFPSHFPGFIHIANVRCLLILMSLSSDIALNTGYINFVFVKDPLIDSTIISNEIDILDIAKTHIQFSYTDSHLKSLTPS